MYYVLFLERLLTPLQPYSEILKILLRDEQLDADVDLAVLARRTEHFSGSDLKRMSSMIFVRIYSANLHLQISASLLH